MNRMEARKIIRERASDSGNIVLTRHALDQMIKRKIDRLDVQRCLSFGSITEGPYRPVDRPNMWRCNVDGISAGARIRVVVDIPEKPPLLFVVTVINLQK